MMVIGALAASLCPLAVSIFAMPFQELHWALGTLRATVVWLLALFDRLDSWVFLFFAREDGRKRTVTGTFELLQLFMC